MAVPRFEREYDLVDSVSSGGLSTGSSSASQAVAKVLAQSAPAATTATDAYTVPARTTAIVSGFIVCNRSATPTTYRISVAIKGATDDVSQYIAYDVAIGANATANVASSLTLSTTDVVRVYAGAATLSFSLLGTESHF